MSDTKEASAVLEHDAAELKKMGYEQELHRHMGGFSNFAISFSIICILAGGISAFPLALGGAGGASIGIGWLVGGLFAAIVALFMAQISSFMLLVMAIFWFVFGESKRFKDPPAVKE